MSGKDERPFLSVDIPECPLCGRMPYFWTLDVTTSKWFWLFSEDYLNRNPTFGKVTYRHCVPIELEDVHMIKCRGRAGGLRSVKSHAFRRGDDNFTETFQAIIRQTQNCIDAGRVRDY